ncbi:MAG: 3-dehydroquinate synthase [Bacteroidota bacterium]
MIPFIALVGFMGTGKTSVGKALAERLGWPYRDSDEWIEKKEGSIPAIFENQGEAAFRDFETEALRTLTNERCVLATGGGAVLREENRALLERGLVVVLDASLATIEERVNASDRPLRGRLKELYEARQPLYRAFPFHFEAEKATPEEIARQIQAWISGKHESLTVPLGEQSYPIELEAGGLLRLGEACREWAPSGRCLLVSDENVEDLYGAIAAESLRASGYELINAVIPPGEGSKTLPMAESLYRSMIENGLDRSSPVIALGGGVVGDLAGFVASTYQRGVPFIQVPTTLLAQIDSSVGGKVAVNHPLAKNMIGTFYQPKGVSIDPLVLRTLPEREWRGGLAELVKYGVILDAELFETLEQNLLALQQRSTAFLMPLIKRACALKAEVVSQDEKEKGLRAILNFGHTIGHAIEAVAGFGTFTHGEAVAIGMVAAGKLAVKRGEFEPKEHARLLSLLHSLGLPTTVPALPIEALLQAMAVDKKNAGGAIRMVLPQSIGTVGLPVPVPPEELVSLLS